MPKVSVIIPVYNAEEYLERCLNSVVNQTLKDIEIICVDDCSSDNSLEILNKYAEQYSNLKVIKHESNGGESKARNSGLAAASGEYLGFVDNDDFIDLDFYEKLYNKAKETNADIVKGNVREIKYDKSLLLRDTNLKIKETQNKMYFNGDWWSAVYKKDLIDSNNINLLEGYPLGADSLFVYLAVINAKSLEVIDDTFYHYIRREQSGASKFLSIAKIQSFMDIIDIILKDMNSRDEQELSYDGYNVVFEHFFNIISEISYLNLTDEAFLISANKIKKAYDLYKYDKNKLFSSDGLLKEYKYLNLSDETNIEELKETVKVAANPKKRIIMNLRKNAATKPSQKIPIFLSSDNNYAPFVATTIVSICENTKSFCEFYVLDCGISQDKKDKIEELKKQYKNFSLEFINVDTEKSFKGFAQTENITKSMYARYLIPYLKPDIDKAIYTDVDVIVVGDIKELYDENIEDYAIGACYESFFKDDLNIERQKNLGLSDTHKYFSSGNLLINCKKWRDDNILEKLVALEKTYHDNLKYPDQDLLNKYFDSNYKILDKKYCYVDIWFTIDKEYNYIIRHYTGDIKPWKIPPSISSTDFPTTKVFWDYVQKTPFYEQLLENTLSQEEFNLKLRQKKLFDACNRIKKKKRNTASEK